MGNWSFGVPEWHQQKSIETTFFWKPHHLLTIDFMFHHIDMENRGHYKQAQTLPHRIHVWPPKRTCVTYVSQWQDQVCLTGRNIDVYCKKKHFHRISRLVKNYVIQSHHESNSSHRPHLTLQSEIISPRFAAPGRAQHFEPCLCPSPGTSADFRPEVFVGGGTSSRFLGSEIVSGDFFPHLIEHSNQKQVWK